MRRRRKQHLVIALIILLLVCVICLIDNFKIDNKKDEPVFDISLYRIEETVKRNIDKREILKLDGNILVGYSKKELENGYYDLKICMEEESLNIYVNKAWKEFNDTLYEEEYINQIVCCIMDVFELDSKDTHNKIYEYVLEGYKVSKGLLDKNLKDDNKLKIEKLKVKQKIENNELILSVSKEVDK